MSSGVRLLLLGAQMELRHVTYDRMILFNAAAQPLFIALIGLLVVGRGGKAAADVAIGSGLCGLWSVIIAAGARAANAEREQGLLEPLLAAPRSHFVGLAGRLCGAAAVALVTTSAVATTAALLGSTSLPIANAAEFAISLSLGVSTLLTLGLLVTMGALRWPAAQRWLAPLEYLAYILGGFLFPVAVLPSWLQPISHASPPYWVARALRATTTAPLPVSELVGTWVVLLLWCATGVFATFVAFQWIRIAAQRDGELGFV